MKKKNVCILQNGLSRGGTDTFIINLCKSFDKAKYNIVLVNPSTKSISTEREDEVKAFDVKIIHTSDLGKGIFSKMKHLIKLFLILKKEKIEIFQTNIDLFNGPNLFIAWLARVPVRCCHSHNTMQQRSIIKGMTFPIRIYQKLMKYLCWKFSNRRTGCSEEAMNFLFTNKKWKQNKYPSIINNGIDLQLYQNKIDVLDKKKEIGLYAKKNILTIGRIIPQKNPVFIAEVISLLCKQRSDVDFVWVGVGYLIDDVRQIFVENNVINRIHFLGSRNDVAEIINCCDIFFMPSIFEGLGIVNIEAQAAGLPCLVSDAIPIEADCGGCKFLSLIENHQVWVNTLNDLLDHKFEYKIDNKRLTKFSLEYMTNQMELVFEQ